MMQRRIWANGKHSSKLRLKNVSFFFFGVLMFLPGVVSAAIAETTLTVKLPKVPPTFKTARVSVTSVEAETANLLASIVLNTKSKKVQLKVKTVPQIVFADLSSSDGNELSAHSHVLRPVDGKKMNVTLQLESGISKVFSKATDLLHGLSSPSADTAWPPVGIDLIGVPSSGLTVEGFGPSSRDIANMVITDLSQAPCYGEGGGFEVVETDPDKLAIRKAEIDLSNSTWGDPSTRLQDLYVSPSMVINGSWTSDGTSLTVTMGLIDSQGRQLLSKSATGPVDNWSEINDQVLNELADAMCPKARYTGWVKYKREFIQFKEGFGVGTAIPMTCDTEVVFEIDPAASTQGVETFRVKEGVVKRAYLTGERWDGCLKGSWTGNSEEDSLIPGEGFLTIDTVQRTYTGVGGTELPLIPITFTWTNFCDPGNPPYSVEWPGDGYCKWWDTGMAGGVVQSFLDIGTFTGQYVFDFVTDTFTQREEYEWELTRRE